MSRRLVVCRTQLGKSLGEGGLCSSAKSANGLPGKTYGPTQCKSTGIPYSTQSRDHVLYDQWIGIGRLYIHRSSSRKTASRGAARTAVHLAGTPRPRVVQDTPGPPGAD